jgi:predicted MFS family arabinose efflux permease
MSTPVGVISEVPGSLRSLHRRLLPLHVAVFLQGFILWVPVEKLFMSEIGFDPATIGVMAAAYAAVVPIVEIPSGILADRWSRRGTLVVATVALLACSLSGGLSTNVLTYILSTLALGVYFAMYSGTLDAMLYDTVLEETGGSGAFATRIGRIRLIESVALVTSSLAGGWIAGLLTPRATYFLSIPFAVLAILAFLRFAEPKLHKVEDTPSLRNQLSVTYRTLATGDVVRPIVAVAVMTAVLMQVVFEFGPLWLVALAAPAALYGPYWAALMSTFGLGGLLAGRVRFGRPMVLRAALSLMVLSSLALNVRTHPAVVTVAQVVLALVLVVISIHVTQQLHDAVPSTIRAGVASGVGALSWIAFLPFALVFGLVSERFGVNASGWMITAAVVVVSVLLSRRRRAPLSSLVPAEARGVEMALAKFRRARRQVTTALLRCVDVVELLTDYLEGALGKLARRRVDNHLAGCGPCRLYLEQMRQTTVFLRQLPTRTMRQEPRGDRRQPEAEG